MVGLHFCELLTGTFSLALQFQEKATPCSIGYALGEVMVLDHVFDVQFFNGNLIALFKDAMCSLEVKITALVGDPLMASGDDFPLFRSTFATFLTP